MSPAVVAGSGLPGQGKGTRWRRTWRARQESVGEEGRNCGPAPGTGDDLSHRQVGGA